MVVKRKTCKKVTKKVVKKVAKRTNKGRWGDSKEAREYQRKYEENLQKNAWWKKQHQGKDLKRKVTMA
jgi:hypothetical protein